MDDNKGFSLIELIIVIAIMAVLIAIITPQLTRYIGSAKTRVDERNLDEVHQQIMNCISDAVTGDPYVAVIMNEDGVKTAEYELRYNRATGVTAITANANANSAFASMLSSYLKEANTISKIDPNKVVINVSVSGSISTGYEATEQYDY